MEKELTRYALKSDYIEKVGHFRKTWKRRLFVLTSSEISYLDGEVVKGKIPLEMITDLEKTEIDDRKFCLFVKTDDDFNKDYTLSFDSDEMREDWMKAILAAKENKPVADSVNRAFVKKNEDDIVEDSKSYFNRMLTAFGETYRDDSFQDVMLRLSSFFSRVAFTGLMSPDELTASCEQVRKMSERIRVDMQHSNLMTQDIEHLFNDLSSSIDYCMKNCQQKKLRTSQESASDSSSNSLAQSTPGSVSPSASEPVSRGIPQHGFSSRYELKETLGSGAYSVVYAAEDKKTHQRYAVKCIKKRDLQKSDVQSLKNEVYIMGQLDHPNIVRLEGFYDDKDYYYIVSELVDGGELFDKIVEKKFYNENEARAVVRTLVETVGYCHKKNIAHRDLKPENILVDSRTGAIKIADFGFAKSTASTDTGRLVTDCGSPWYVAPEILKGHLYGTEVDMWSLGVIIYILLCGYPPFHDSNQPRLFRKIRAGQYRFDSPYWDNVSDQAKDLIRHLLVVDPTQRYDAQQVLNHEWFRASADTGKKELGSVIRELRMFNTQRKGIIKQGYLVKQGHFIRNWKKRSFVLLRDELKYYKSETEKKPQGKIPMEDILELEDDLNEPNGFVIKTRSGKDFNINAGSQKEKEDWMVQISGVKRCYLMRQRAQEHINRRHYKPALELVWEARNVRSMMTDPNLVQLWGQIAAHNEAECGAMFMVESLEETMEGNVSVLAYCTAGKDGEMQRVIAGDFNGNVVLFGGDYSVIQRQKLHRNMVTAISTLNKLEPTRFVATGAADGSVCVLNVETGAAVMSVKDLRRAVSCVEVFESKETNRRRLITADREGRIVIYDLDAKRIVAEKETDCGNVRGVFYFPGGDKFVMVCESGSVIVFDEVFNQLNFMHVGQSVMYAKPIDTTHIMMATEGKELVTYDLMQCNQEPVKVLKLQCKDPIRCFDVTTDGKYAIVVSNEIEFWKLSNQHCEANLSPILPVRCMCLTSDFISFFMSQDTHIEKWVIDWKIVYEGKKYCSPLSQFIPNDTNEANDEDGSSNADEAGKQGGQDNDAYKGTIETVNEEDEEEDEDSFVSYKHNKRQGPKVH